MEEYLWGTRRCVGDRVGARRAVVTDMTTETTAKLDARFSDGTPRRTRGPSRAVLEQAELDWLTTVRADGRPDVSG